MCGKYEEEFPWVGSGYSGLPILPAKDVLAGRQRTNTITEVRKLEHETGKSPSGSLYDLKFFNPFYQTLPDEVQLEVSDRFRSEDIT